MVMEYNRNDCVGLYEILEKFFGEFEAYAETVASFALQVFQRHYLSRCLCKVNRAVEDFIRESYFGGRCEVYRWDKAKLNKFDVNSLYPSVMREPVPVEFRGASQRLTERENEIGFYEAEVSYPESYFPVLPCICRGRLFFPIGKFTGKFTSIELHKAISDGAAIKIKRGYVFSSEPIFREFAEDLFKKRLEAKAAGNLAVDWVCKKVLNSCYGKFGQRREQKCYITDPGTERLRPLLSEHVGLNEHDLQAINPRLWPVGSPGSGIVYFERESKAGHILPHISSAITSRARLITRGYLQKPDRVWYTDTDSIFTDGEIETGKKLGEVKLEGIGNFEPYGLKEYRFDGHYNIKGVSVMTTDLDSGVKTESPEIAERYLSGEQLQYDRRAGFLESLRDGELTFRSLHAVKQRQPRIEKRAREMDRIETRPWNTAEIEKFNYSLKS